MRYLWAFAVLVTCAVLMIAVRATAQVIEQVEGETTIRSEDGGQTIAVELPGGVPLEMVWIEPGTFTLGSPESDVERSPHERSQVELTINQGFYFGKYEITQNQWVAVMDTKPWQGEGHVQESPIHPAVYISWYDLQTFIKKLNETANGRPYSLAAGADWEYVCRAETRTRWSFGDDENQLDNYAWYKENAEDVQPVGTKLPNPWGLYDMHGNVSEWSRDTYVDADHSGPVGADSTSFRIVKGGSYQDVGKDLRSAARFRYLPTYRAPFIGARLFRLGPILSDEMHWERDEELNISTAASAQDMDLVEEWKVMSVETVDGRSIAVDYPHRITFLDRLSIESAFDSAAVEDPGFESEIADYLSSNFEVKADGTRWMSVFIYDGCNRSEGVYSIGITDSTQILSFSSLFWSTAKGCKPYPKHDGPIDLKASLRGATRSYEVIDKTLRIEVDYPYRFVMVPSSTMTAIPSSTWGQVKQERR